MGGKKEMGNERGRIEGGKGKGERERGRTEERERESRKMGGQEELER